MSRLLPIVAGLFLAGCIGTFDVLEAVWMFQGTIVKEDGTSLNGCSFSVNSSRESSDKKISKVFEVDSHFQVIHRQPLYSKLLFIEIDCGTDFYTRKIENLDSYRSPSAIYDLRTIIMKSL